MRETIKVLRRRCRVFEAVETSRGIDRISCSEKSSVRLPSMAAESALPTSLSSGVRRSRSKENKVFQSSCLGLQSGSHESEHDEPFWSGAAGNAVVIEADAFKESDVIYKAFSSRGHHDILQTAELESNHVQKSSELSCEREIIVKITRDMQTRLQHTAT